MLQPIWNGSRRIKQALPYRPSPLPDELTTSWLVRVAHGLRISPFAFSTGFWPQKVSLLGQDLDAYCPEVIMRDLATACNCPFDRALQTSLRTLIGNLVEEMPIRGRKTWVLPITAVSHKRKHHGLQFCPTCLATESWKMAADYGRSAAANLEEAREAIEIARGFISRVESDIGPDKLKKGIDPAVLAALAAKNRGHQRLLLPPELT
jgi:hypothetical protein|tara:strand:- start:1217 stop:1837 length:621 start_codon:yes stop_codon:yes gene_type:complete